ncbi:MAG TPA: serine/threonine-protein kinase, partial [Steroidobacteraceae bacterium]|nr:serine/threonine-protein kinase [Steroidobacteraceae bacterium]
LDAALELSPDARRSWIESLDPQYDAVKPSLLRVLDGAANLTPQEFEAGTAALLADSEFHAGERLGPYVLVRPIGQGGMGEVWLAVRGDGTLKRPVALKLPHAHLLSGALRRRFERERDILAALTHPHIARLYDAGVSEGGHPYLAMELVNGLPVTRYCEERHCRLDERLGLFRQILEAVHYAHMRFIAHRDLKPSNILVTAEGEIKLLDFGIAKLLAPDETTGHTELTRLGDQLLTPDYAAPEQLRGGPITTASDVYTLGVVLFVLLTGRRPFDTERRATESEPPRASSVITPQSLPACGLDARALRRALRGDLDAILAKALHPDPAQRYSSALALAADLEHYAAHEPIVARRAGRALLIGKFLYRHRLGAAGAALLLASILAGAAGIAWQAQLVRREAQREAAVKNFLIGVFKVSDPRVAAEKPRDQVTARDLLDMGAQRIDDASLGDADAQIELLGTLAEIYYALGDRDRYRNLRDQQLRLAAKRYGPDNRVAIDALLFEAKQVADLDGDYPRTQALLARAAILMQRAGSEDPVQRARWWSVRAMTLRGHLQTAAAWHQALLHAVQLYAQHAPHDEGYPETLGELGNYYFTRESDPRQAASYFRASALAFDQVDDPDRSEQAEAYSNLGNTLAQLGELDAAEAAFARGLDLLRRTYGESRPLYWVPAASYALLVHWRGDRLRAQQMFEQVKRSIPPQDAGLRTALEVNEMYAYCLLAEGRAAEAVPLLETAERSFLAKPTQADDLPRVRGRLGLAYEMLGRREDARHELHAVLDTYTSSRRPDSAAVLRIRERWGNFLLEESDIAGAEAQFREVARWSKVHDQGQLYVALAEGGLARIDLLHQDAHAGLQDIASAERTFATLRASHDVRWGPYLWLIHARVLSAAGDARGAEQWARRALQADESYDAPGSPSITEARAVLDAARRQLAGGAEPARVPLSQFSAPGETPPPRK